MHVNSPQSVLDHHNWALLIKSRFSNRVIEFAATAAEESRNLRGKGTTFCVYVSVNVRTDVLLLLTSVFPGRVFVLFCITKPQ